MANNCPCFRQLTPFYCHFMVDGNERYGLNPNVVSFKALIYGINDCCGRYASEGVEGKGGSGGRGMDERRFGVEGIYHSIWWNFMLIA